MGIASGSVPCVTCARRSSAAGRKYVFFVDDNLFVDVAKAKELFAAVKPLGVNWFCQTSIDIARDRALVSLMAKSGCSSALFGFESLRA
jgi:hypothetical protein